MARPKGKGNTPLKCVFVYPDVKEQLDKIQMEHMTNYNDIIKRLLANGGYSKNRGFHIA